MKRIGIYIALLAAAMLFPVKGMDVGKLKPVGLIQLYKEGETVFLVTDTGDSGRGETVDSAFKNLEETTAGVIFLDTADYLLLSRTAVKEVGKIVEYLKPSIRVCLADKGIDPTQAAAYLAVHKPALKLKHYGKQENLQVLVETNDRLILK